jgi:hypothetical protein
MTKHKSTTKDVTRKSNPILPPTYTTGKLGAMGERNGTAGNVAPGPKPKPTAMPTQVSGFSKGIKSRPSNHNTNRSFTLPSSINPMDTYNERFAGRRMNYNFNPKQK